MVCDLKFNEDLATRLEAAATAAKLTVEELIVVATAEKLARMEHETWLGKQVPEVSAGTADQPVLSEDRKP